MGFSFLAMALIRSALPDEGWRILLSGFGYTLGFLIVVLGRQQLFTETTLTAVIPALTRRDLRTMLATARVWIIVLVANLIGTLSFAVVSAQEGVFSPEAYEAMGKLSQETMAHPILHTLVTAGSAGGLVGPVVG